MKPVAIFRHASIEGAAYFATFLEAHRIPFRVIAVGHGNLIPANPDTFSGLCFMGGPMSVNDPLPWIEEECALIREAVNQKIPVIGHCLGGQLMSKALGGSITRNPVKEIGWGCVDSEDNAIAKAWLGKEWNKTPDNRTVFQWHGETFSIPPGATRLLSSEHCTNQMFALGPHLGMQCHIEMTSEMINKWCNNWQEEVAGLQALPNSIQTPGQIQSETAVRLPRMRQLADQLYSMWITGLAR